MTAAATLEKIHSPAFADTLRLLYGENEAVLTAQKTRWAAAVAEYVRLFGDSPELALFSTPGRTEIGGNHTDHNNGCVLAAAVNLDTIAVAAPSGSGAVALQSEGFPLDALTLDLLSPRDAERHTSSALIRGAAARLEQLGYVAGGFHAYTTSQVLKGSGLSSSAAFEVLLVTIFDHLFNSGAIHPMLAAQIGQFAENHFFGKPCGLMDQTACAFGGFVSIDFENLADPLACRVPFDFAHSGFALIITDTRGDHAALNDEYAAIRLEMQAVARALGAEVLRQTCREAVLAEAPRIRREAGDRALLRALHYFDENDRVLAQREALEKNDLRRFLELVIASGRSSWMLLQNCYVPGASQSVALGLAVSETLLRDSGAWRVHGGGFAGTIQAFVPDAQASVYCAAMDALFGPGAAQRLSVRPAGTIRL